MKNFFVFFIIGWLMLTFSACAQTSFIKRASAYASERKTGTEMLDDNGSPAQRLPTSQYTVYIELSGEAPEWKNAWYNYQMFSITATKVELSMVDVGINRKTGKREIIKPANKGNELWQLDLLPVNPSSKQPVKTKPGEVLLKGLRNQKMFYYKVPKTVFLQTPDAV